MGGGSSKVHPLPEFDQYYEDVILPNLAIVEALIADDVNWEDMSEVNSEEVEEELLLIELEVLSEGDLEEENVALNGVQNGEPDLEVVELELEKQELKEKYLEACLQLMLEEVDLDLELEELKEEDLEEVNVTHQSAVQNDDGQAIASESEGDCANVA